MKIFIFYVFFFLSGSSDIDSYAKYMQINDGFIKNWEFRQAKSFYDDYDYLTDADQIIDEEILLKIQKELILAVLIYFCASVLASFMIAGTLDIVKASKALSEPIEEERESSQ
ncbi:hypothetical protein V6Z05_14935 [Leptospira venezuelensis]|uniref:hypothetical protein n=1 Tax=Leptospira venezuelensis TaxID=1958811 RepID=UPI000A3889A9|nr:hypothetical protein [Leptospira venezuelensis]